MKKISVTLATLIISTTVFANGERAPQNPGQHMQQRQTSTAESSAVNTGVNGNNNVTFSSPADTSTTVHSVSDGNQNVTGTQTIKNVPSMGGPNLTSSNDTCMGSASGALAGPGFGVSLGKTYLDQNCVMLKNSREMWNMGMKAAAMALMCTDANNREALEITGYECPQTTKARNGNLAVQRAAQSSQEQYTDPIVRARLDLPLLSN